MKISMKEFMVLMDCLTSSLGHKGKAPVAINFTYTEKLREQIFNSLFKRMETLAIGQIEEVMEAIE